MQQFPAESELEEEAMELELVFPTMPARAASGGAAPTAAGRFSGGPPGQGTHPRQGRVVRVEYPRGITDAEWEKWKERHPNNKLVDGANLVNGKRTEDPKFSPRSLRARGYYFAKIIRFAWKQAWEFWLNDEGDGRMIWVQVPY